MDPALVLIEASLRFERDFWDGLEPSAVQYANALTEAVREQARRELPQLSEYLGDERKNCLDQISQINDLFQTEGKNLDANDVTGFLDRYARCRTSREAVTPYPELETLYQQALQAHRACLIREIVWDAIERRVRKGELPPLAKKGDDDFVRLVRSLSSSACDFLPAFKGFENHVACVHRDFTRAYTWRFPMLNREVGDVPKENPAGRDNAGPATGTQVEIGKGGQGVIQTDDDGELGRKVVLKRLRPDQSPQVAWRLEREARILAQLGHPGVPAVFCFGRDHKDLPFFAMELIPGHDLKDWLHEFHNGRRIRGGIQRRNRHFLSLLRRFIAVCYTIAYAHDRDLVHRDLKPDNIMFGKLDETYVIDWGVAKYVGEEDQIARSSQWLVVDRTISAGVVGTYDYMSPEQARPNDRDVNAKLSDVYSLGAVLYHIIAGRSWFSCLRPNTIRKRLQGIQPELPNTPNTGRLKAIRIDDKLARAVCDSALVTEDISNSVHEAKRQLIGRVPLPRPRPKRRVAVDRELQAICLRAMAEDPVQRYQSAQDLAERLERWMADAAHRDYRAPILSRPFIWLRRHPRIRRMVRFGLAMVLVGWFGFTWWRDAGETERYFRRANEFIERDSERWKHKLAENAQDRVALESLQEAAQYFKDVLPSRSKGGRYVAQFAKLLMKRAGIYRSMGHFRGAPPLSNKSTQERGALEDYEEVIRELDAAEQHGQLVRSMEGSEYWVPQRIAATWLDFAPTLVGSAYRRKLLADAHHELATVLDDTDDLDRSKREYLTSLGLRDAVLRVRDSDTMWGKWLQSVPLEFGTMRESLEYLGGDQPMADKARCLGYLGDIELALGDHEPAERSYRESLKLRRDIFKRDKRDETAGAHKRIMEAGKQLARGRANFGRLHISRNDPEYGIAFRWFQDAERLQRNLVADAADDPAVRSDLLFDLAASLYHRGECHLGLGDLPTARQVLEDTEGIFGEFVARGVAVVDNQRMLALTRVALAEVHMEAAGSDPGGLQTARDKLTPGLSELERLKNYPGTPRSRADLARALLIQGKISVRDRRHAEAAKAFRIASDAFDELKSKSRVEYLRFGAEARRLMQTLETPDE